MKLIVCLDERKGMMFNNRRQSRDRVLIDNMIEMIGDDKLYIAPYSESLFENKEIKLKVKKNPLKAADEGWCFIGTDTTPAISFSIWSLTPTPLNQVRSL